MCLKGDFAHVAVLEEMYEKLQRRPRGDKSVEVPSQEVDDDDDEEEEEGTVYRRDGEGRWMMHD